MVLEISKINDKIFMIYHNKYNYDRIKKEKLQDPELLKMVSD